MNSTVQLCVLFLYTGTQMRYLEASIYFHEPSFLEIRPKMGSDADFGFSLGYQNGIRANLVVGAPHTADSIGQVYSCPLKDLFKSPPNCTKIPIDIDDIAPDTVNDFIHPKQSFCLGASIAATSDYLLTCAPLWSTKVPYYYARPPNPWRVINNTYASGTCFMYDGNTTYRYQGSLEQHKLLVANKSQFTYPEVLIGGTGWTTLVDNTNRLILISKQSSPVGDVTFLDMTHPTQPTKSLVLNQNDTHRRNNIGYEYLKDFNNIAPAALWIIMLCTTAETLLTILICTHLLHTSNK